MQKQPQLNRIIDGLAVIGTLINQSSAQGQRGSKRKSRNNRIPKDAVDLHGETHDHIQVQSPKGQFLPGNTHVKMFTKDGGFLGKHDEQGLIEIEAGARTARAMLIARQQAAASAGSQ